MKNLFCNDLDGNILSKDDLVVLLDSEDLEDNPPSRGQLLRVVECIDAESNYISFHDSLLQGCAFYGHRVLKVKP